MGDGKRRNPPCRRWPAPYAGGIDAQGASASRRISFWMPGHCRARFCPRSLAGCWGPRQSRFRLARQRGSARLLTARKSERQTARAIDMVPLKDWVSRPGMPRSGRRTTRSPGPSPSGCRWVRASRNGRPGARPGLGPPGRARPPSPVTEKLPLESRKSPGTALE